jgi:sugar/nucleoside kinase (ribokinase family)
MLIEEGFEVRAVHRPAGTGWYVHDRRRGERDRIAEGAGAPLYRHDVDELYNIALAEGLRADVCLLGGPAHDLLEGDLVLVHPPAIETVDPSGAGDSMTAAIATMLARGADLEEAVRVGAAAGAVNVARHGLGTGHADAIGELANRVKLQPIGAEDL